MRNLRRFLAMALTIMMVAGCFSMFSVNAFEDVYDFEEAIDTLNELGVIKGYDETSFGPDDDVLRWHMALLTSKLVTGKVETATWETASNYSNFTDVKAEHYFGSISYASNHGIIIGTSATTFEPEGQIMFQDALTMVIRALGFGGDEMDKGYPYTYIAKANKLGLTAGLEYIESYNDYLTRGETAQLLYNALYTVNAEDTTFAESAFGMEAADEYLVVITATNNANIVSDALVEKTDYVAFNEIMVDGTLNENVTYFLPKSEFGIEGDADLYVGASYKVYTTDGFKSIAAYEAIEAVAVEVAGNVDKNTALVKLDDTVYQVVESFTALNASKVNIGNYPEIIMYAKNVGYTTATPNGMYVADAAGNLLDVNGQVVAYYMPNLVGYTMPYVVYDAITGVYRAATSNDLTKVAIVNGTTVGAYKVVADTLTEIANVGAIYDAVAYDDNGDGTYDRAFFVNYRYGQYILDADGHAVIGGLDTGVKAELVKVVDAEGNPATLTVGGYYLYAYNAQSKTITVKEELTVYTGYVSGMNSLQSKVTIGGTVYNYGIANLPGASAAEVGVGPEIVGKNVNYVLVDGVVVDILALGDCGYIVFDSVIGVTSTGLPTALVYNNSNILSVIVVSTIDTYSYYQFAYNSDALTSNVTKLENTAKGSIFTAEIDALGYYHLMTVAGVQTATANFAVDFINGVTNNEPAIGGQFKTTADTIILVYNTTTETFTARKGIPGDGAVLTVGVGSEYFVKTSGNAITYIYVYGDATFTGTTQIPAWGTTTTNTTVVYVDPAYAEPTIVSNSLSSVIGVEGITLQGYTYKYNVIDMATGKAIDVYTASYNAQLIPGAYYLVTNGYVDCLAADDAVKTAEIISVSPFYSVTSVATYDRQEVVILAIDPISGVVARDADGQPINYFGNEAYDIAVNRYAIYYDVAGTTKVYFTADGPIGCPVLSVANGDGTGMNYGVLASDAAGSYYSSSKANCPVVVWAPAAALNAADFFASDTAKLVIELYVDGADKVTYGDFEFYTSACDYDEVNINLGARNLQDGWNTIIVVPNTMTPQGAGTFNPASIAQFRIYLGCAAGDEVQYGIRNIYFYDDGVAFVEPELPGEDDEEEVVPQDTLIDVTNNGDIWGAGTAGTDNGRNTYTDATCPVYCEIIASTATEMPDYVKVKLYVSDPALLKTDANHVMFEINNADSSKTLAWDLSTYEFVAGWNELTLNVADAVTTTLDNIAELGSTRFFAYVTESATISVDAIQLGYIAE